MPAVTSARERGKEAGGIKLNMQANNLSSIQRFLTTITRVRILSDILHTSSPINGQSKDIISKH